MYSDASLKGWGVYMGQNWLAGSWKMDDQLHFKSCCDHISLVPEDFFLDTTNINELELWPIFVAIRTWSHRLQHSTLILYSDNTQVLVLLSNYVSTNTNCLRLLRDLFWVLVCNDIQLEARYIATEENILTDTLSRLYYPDKWSVKCDFIKNSQLCCNTEFSSFLYRSKNCSRQDVLAN